MAEDRKTTLLIAAYKLLRSCDEGPYVKNVLTETVHYDDTECDGYCLMQDIEVELEESGIETKHIFTDY